MSSLGHYKEETAHLNEQQRMLYEAAEYTLLTLSQNPEGFVNATIAVETLAMTMRKSLETFKKRYH